MATSSCESTNEGFHTVTRQRRESRFVSLTEENKQKIDQALEMIQQMFNHLIDLYDLFTNEEMEDLDIYSDVHSSRTSLICARFALNQIILHGGHLRVCRRNHPNLDSSATSANER